MPENECVQLGHDLVGAFNAHDLEGIRRLLSDTVLVVSPEGPVGPYGWEVRTADHFKAFPDSAWTQARLSGKGEEFLLEILWIGTQRVPPTNRPLRIPVAIRGVVKRHKIETLRLDYDRELVLRQLPRPGEAVEAPPPPEARVRLDPQK